MELTPDQRAVLTEVQGKFNTADRVHQRLRQRWDHFYALYRNYTDFSRSLTDASPRDRDSVIGDGQAAWGAQLFIPMVFSIIETILPRMLSNRPRMLVTPRRGSAQDNAEAMRLIIDSQQDQIDYELILQDIAKDGLIYGLGVQKTFWLNCTDRRQVQAPSLFDPTKMVVADRVVTVFDDPMAECVDPHDFLWDPFGDELQTPRCNVDYVIHRTWRSTKYVKYKLDTGQWPLPLVPADYESTGTGKAKYEEVWADRKKVDSLPFGSRSDLHEVWEFHDGERVIVILDRQWPVLQAVNPANHGQIPFQVYRPTKVPHELAGIGEVAPVEDLQQELNSLRSARRDNARLKMQQSFAYWEGLVDPTDIEFGPGMLVPVNGDPREVLFPIQQGDIPNSGYSEENSIKQDFDRTSGVSDQSTGADTPGGASVTATGAQLQESSLSKRIENKTRRIEIEVVKGAARQWLELNQQHILTNRQVRVPAMPTPDQPDRRWAWLPVGPVELAGEFDIQPEGGSTTPSQPLQDQQTAQQFSMLFAQNPLVNPQQATTYMLKKFGIQNPEQFMQQPQLPPQQAAEVAQAHLMPGNQPDQQQQGQGQQGRPGPAPQPQPQGTR